MPRIPLHRLTPWITTAAVDHRDGLVEALMAHAACSRATARKRLAELAAAGWLQAEGHGRRRRYRAGAMREVVHSYALAGLQDDQPWRRDFARYFEFSAPLRQMLRHAMGELVNNAIDHSGGSQVMVSLRQTATQAQLLVSDDGCGLFEHLQARFAITSPEAAVLELAKGRLTSDPARHTGRGLFYTFRLADVVMLHANTSAFQQLQWEGLRWRAGRPLPRRGTSIYLAIALDSPRRLADVLRSASADGSGLGVQRVSLPLHLVADQGCLASRAEARRVLARLEGLQQVELDFGGIEELGHSFADELFRVGAGRIGAARLVPTHMSRAVEAMVKDAAPALLAA